MNFKYFVVVSILLLANNRSVVAQTSLGIKFIGSQVSSFSNTSSLPSAGNQFKDKDYGGLVFGFTYRKALKNQNFITAEILYSMRGQNASYSTNLLNGSLITNSNGQPSSIEYINHYRTHYLEIPILYTLNLMGNQQESKVHVYIGVGFSTGINLLAQNIKNSFSGGPSFSIIQQTTIETDLPQTKPILFNFVGDFELEFRQQKKAKYFIYGRLNQSITNVFDSSFSSTRLGSYGFGIGMRWKLKD